MILWKLIECGSVSVCLHCDVQMCKSKVVTFKLHIWYLVSTCISPLHQPAMQRCRLDLPAHVSLWFRYEGCAKSPNWQNHEQKSKVWFWFWPTESEQKIQKESWVCHSTDIYLFMYCKLKSDHKSIVNILYWSICYFMLDITGPPLLDRHRALKVRKQMWRSGQLERMLILLDLREALNLPTLCKNVLRRRPNLPIVTVIHPSSIPWRHRVLKMKRGNFSCQFSWINVVQYGCVFTYSRCLQCKLCHFLTNCFSNHREITEEKKLSFWMSTIIMNLLHVKSKTNHLGIHLHFRFYIWISRKIKTLSLLVLVNCFL